MQAPIAAFVGLFLFAGIAHGQEASAPAASDCSAKAAEKKLAGAALNSFMKKCERDSARSACDASAGEKKLHGAAKTSFMKKCVKDAAAR